MSEVAEKKDNKKAKVEREEREEQIATLQQSLHQTENREKMLREEMEEEVSQLKQLLEEKDRELCETNECAREDKRKAEHLKKDNEKAKVEKEERDEQIATIQQSLQQTQNRKKMLKEEMDEEVSQFKQLLEEKDKELCEANDRAREEKMKAEHLKKDNEKAEVEKEERDDQIVTLQQSLHQTQNRVKMLKEEMDEEVSQLKQLLEEKDKELCKVHLNKLQDTQSALEEAKLKYASLEEELKRQLAERDEHHLQELSQREGILRKELSEQEERFKRELAEQKVRFEQELAEREENLKQQLSKKEEAYRKEHQNIAPDIRGTSLTPFMPEHVQKSKAGVVDTRQGLGIPSLSVLTIGSNSPPSIVSNQNSLPLGTLALSMSSASQSSAPSLLSVPLSSLSLNNTKITATSSSLAAPPGFMSFNSVLQSNQLSLGAGTRIKATMADLKGSPSLADLIQVHSNQSPTTLGNSFPPSQSSLTSVKCQRMAAPAQPLSLSEVNLQHQDRNTSIHSQSQSTERPANTLNFTKPTNITPACLGGTISLSQLAVQHNTNSSLVSPHLVTIESPASALKQPPAISEPLCLSHLASTHKGKTSTTSNGSQYSLTSLLSPELAGALAESTVEGGTKHKPCHQNCRPCEMRQTYDLRVLMAQSEAESPPNFDSGRDRGLPSPVSPPLDTSVFAKPSAFAMALCYQSSRKQKGTDDKLKGKIRGSAFMCKSHDKSKEQHASLPPITPFLFDTPSPDDIVLANRLKPFTMSTKR